jgi:hypothetical protein
MNVLSRRMTLETLLIATWEVEMCLKWWITCLACIRPWVQSSVMIFLKYIANQENTG